MARRGAGVTPAANLSLSLAFPGTAQARDHAREREPSASGPKRHGIRDPAAGRGSQEPLSTYATPAPRQPIVAPLRERIAFLPVGDLAPAGVVVSMVLLLAGKVERPPRRRASHRLVPLLSRGTTWRASLLGSTSSPTPRGVLRRHECRDGAGGARRRAAADERRARVDQAIPTISTTSPRAVAGS